MTCWHNSKVGVWKVLFRWFSSSFQTMSTRMERWMPQILPWSEEFPEKIWGNSWAYSCPALSSAYACRPHGTLCLHRLEMTVFKKRAIKFHDFLTKIGPFLWWFGGSRVFWTWWLRRQDNLIGPPSKEWYDSFDSLCPNLPTGFYTPFFGKRPDSYHHFKINCFIWRRLFCYRCGTAPFLLRQKLTRQWQARGIPKMAEVAWCCMALQWAFDSHFQLRKHFKMLLTPEEHPQNKS